MLGRPSQPQQQPQQYAPVQQQQRQQGAPVAQGYRPNPTGYARSAGAAAPQQQRQRGKANGGAVGVGGWGFTWGWPEWQTGFNFMIFVNFLILCFLLIAAIWFFTTVHDEELEHNVLAGIHKKHHRIFIQRNMVNVYNHTTLGVAVFQGGMLIGSPTIPGSGYLIVNKRSLRDSIPTRDEHPMPDPELSSDPRDEDFVFWDPEGKVEANMRKRQVQAYRPASRYSGINIRDHSNITMNGGDIVGVGTIYAHNIVGARNVSVGSTVGFTAGLAAGPLINGSYALGFAGSPVSGPPIVNQLFFLNPDDADYFSSTRFNEDKFAILYQATSGGELLAVVGTVDSNNEATYSAAGTILAAGVLGTDMQTCSLEAADGTGANVLLVVYRSAIDTNIYARVCDLTVPATPVCGPSTNVTAGDLGVNGVLVYDSASNIHINSITCLVHPDDGASTTQRWFVLGATTNNSGIKMAQKTNANVATALPGSIPRTPTVIVGNVVNLTDTSTSTDLANQGKHVMQVDRLLFGYFVIAWRTGTSLDNGKLEVDYINTTAVTIQLTTRSPEQWVTIFENQQNDPWMFDISASQAQSLFGGNVQLIYIGYNIGASNFGKLYTIILAVPATASTPFVASPWVESETVEFANDINPQTTLDTTPQSATFTVESMCLNQVLVSYSSGGVSVRNPGYTVLLNVFPAGSCQDAGGCVTVSTRAPFTNTVPYYARTMWRTLSSDGFACTGADFTQFVTAITIYDDFAYVNTSIYAGMGVAGEYTVSYGAFDKPRQVTGITVASYVNQSLVTLQGVGSVNVCSWADGIGGYGCPFEAPSPVYACASGELSFSPFCTASNLRSPGQFVGYVTIDGDLITGVPGPSAA